MACHPHLGSPPSVFVFVRSIYRSSDLRVNVSVADDPSSGWQPRGAGPAPSVSCVAAAPEEGGAWGPGLWSVCPAVGWHHAELMVRGPWGLVWMAGAMARAPGVGAAVNGGGGGQGLGCAGQEQVLGGPSFRLFHL